MEGNEYAPGPGSFNKIYDYTLKIFATKILEFETKLRASFLQGGVNFVVEGTWVLFVVFYTF